MASKLSLLFGNALRSSSSSFRRSSIGVLSPLRTLCTTTTEGGAVDSSSSSTAATVEEQTSDPPPSFDPFLRDKSASGLVFAKLSPVGRSSLKTDIVNFLEGCKLSIEDVKVEYNRVYNQIGMIVQFPSRSSYDTALKVVSRKGRLYRIEKVDRSQWDLLESYNEKVVLLQGIPRNAVGEDIERFLCGCNYDGSDFKIFLRPGIPEPVKMALVNFPSRYEAMHAFRTKNHNFILNNSISMRVLQ